jgi:hypothetical protein
MSELAGAIGSGRVLVFQPATPTGAGLELALGIQRFWQRSLKSAGRPAASILALTRVESIQGTVPDDLPIAVGDRGVACLRDWADPKANAALVQAQGCRWGLISTLVATEASAKLDTVLVEARSGDSPTLGSWSFDSAYGDLPAHVADVLADICRRVGTRPPWTTAAEAFDSADPGASLLVLEQLGVLSMAEDSCRLVIHVVLDRLELLATAAPRSQVVIALVPELLSHLARLGAHDIQLAGWLKRVKNSIGVLPQEWEGLVEKLSRERGRAP